ncbi:MAG: hypothetical protein Q9223_002981 [Gallowayella weberi]
MPDQDMSTDGNTPPTTVMLDERACISYKITNPNERCTQQKLMYTKKYDGQVNGPEILKQLCSRHGKLHREDPTRLKFVTNVFQVSDVNASAAETQKHKDPTPSTVTLVPNRTANAAVNGSESRSALIPPNRNNKQQEPSSVQRDNVNAYDHRLPRPGNPDLQSKSGSQAYGPPPPDRRNAFNQYQPRQASSEHTGSGIERGGPSVTTQPSYQRRHEPRSRIQSSDRDDESNIFLRVLEEGRTLHRLFSETREEFLHSEQAKYEREEAHLQEFGGMIANVNSRLVKEAERASHTIRTVEESSATVAMTVNDAATRLQELEARNHHSSLAVMKNVERLVYGLYDEETEAKEKLRTELNEQLENQVRLHL